MSLPEKIKYFINEASVYSSWVEISKFSSIVWLKLAVLYITVSAIASKIIDGVSSVCFGVECLNLSLPFNWRFLFIGSLLYVIGFVIYYYKCPSFIKKFPTFSEFSRSSYISSDVASDLAEIEDYIENLDDSNVDEYLELSANDIRSALDGYNEIKGSSEAFFSDTGDECVDLMANELIEGKSSYKACYNTIVTCLESYSCNYKKVVLFLYFSFFISLFYSLLCNIFDVFISIFN